MYREHHCQVDGAVLWRGTTDERSTSRILPDGCMDLIWDGTTLQAVGPDRTARLVDDPVGRTRHAIRFAPGRGASIIGVPADALVDQQVDVAQIWAAGRARQVTERLAASDRPELELERLALDAQHDQSYDQLAVSLIAAMAAAGTPVPVMAAEVGWSERHLRRLCLAAFGYGPKLLGRILRLQRALDQVRMGTPLALVAATCGYSDQAHLARDVRALASATLTDFVPASVS